MPRYFFHIREDDTLIVDPDGDDLPDLAQAHRLVLDIIRDILVRPETYGSALTWSSRRFEITDASGSVLLTVPFPSV